jgi:hypothetical protein
VAGRDGDGDPGRMALFDAQFDVHGFAGPDADELMRSKPRPEHFLPDEPLPVSIRCQPPALA